MLLTPVDPPAATEAISQDVNAAVSQEDGPKITALSHQDDVVEDDVVEDQVGPMTRRPYQLLAPELRRNFQDDVAEDDIAEDDEVEDQVGPMAPRPFQMFDPELRRNFQTQTTTHDSMPDMINVPNLTQGTLPDLAEGFSEESAASRDPSLSARSATSSTTEEAVARGRLAVGSMIRVRSASLGKDIEGVVTDNNGDTVKVTFFVNGRSCFKVVPRHEWEAELLSMQAGGAEAAGAETAGAEAVRAEAASAEEGYSSGSSASIRQGPSAAARGQARWSRQASLGRSTKSRSSRQATAGSSRQAVAERAERAGSPESRLEAQARDARSSSSHSEESATRGRTMVRSDDLTVGSTVAIRSTSLGRPVEGIVTDVAGNLVRVQYFMGGRSCTKAMPRSAVTTLT